MRGQKIDEMWTAAAQERSGLSATSKATAGSILVGTDIIVLAPKRAKGLRVATFWNRLVLILIMVKDRQEEEATPYLVLH